MRYLFLAAITATACNGSTGDTGGSTAPDPAAGETLYSDNCALCHGDDGKLGLTGASDLTVAVPTLTDDEIANIVQNGETKSGFTMQPVAISDSEMPDLLAYLRQQFP